MEQPDTEIEPSFDELLQDTSGIVMTEYTVLLGLVTSLSAMTFYAFGVPFWQAFRLTQAIIAAPTP